MGDVVCTSETYFSSQDIIRYEGHRLCVHRGDYYVSGIVMLILDKYVQTINYFIYISDREMVIDMQMGYKMIRIINVYFPNVDYLWEDFVNVMNQIL